MQGDSPTIQRARYGRSRSRERPDRDTEERPRQRRHSPSKVINVILSPSDFAFRHLSLLVNDVVTGMALLSELALAGSQCLRDELCTCRRIEQERMPLWRLARTRTL